MQVERLSHGLQARGCEVVVDLSGSADPSDFDIVHLYNFATADYTEALAKRAYEAGVPYVVTTLYEEVPSFHNQSHALARHLFDYMRTGQDQGWWQRTILDFSTVAKAPRFRVDWIVAHAAALLTNGSRETASIKRDFPYAKNLVEVPLGHEVGATVGSELFVKEYGVRDFVLCVGRFETRKNQLMLLRALEDSDLTVVLASGGFSYQPDYDWAVRNFRRKGRTVIVERVTAEMLSSAYAACRIHALPSWYELPGHVSLEAASYGKNVVVTDTGTQADYFGPHAFYCQPWDLESIQRAVMDAVTAPFPEEFLQVARSYSWENTVERTLEVYKMIAQSSGTRGTSESVTVRAENSSLQSDINPALLSILERGERAVRRGDLVAAQQMVSQVAHELPEHPRMLRLQGAIHLSLGRFDDAAVSFAKALAVLSGEEELVAAYRVALKREDDTRSISSLVNTLLGAVDWEDKASADTRSHELGATEPRSESTGGSILSPNLIPSRPSYPAPETSASTSTATSEIGSAARVESLIAEAESISSNAEFQRAHQLLDEALSIDPGSAHALRVKGTFLLADSNPTAAASFFESSLKVDPRDPRALTGFSFCHIAQNNFPAAYPFLVRAVKEDPHHMLSLLGLVECAYAVGRFDDLIEALTVHLATHSSDKEMRYCLAAALFKEGKVIEAEREVALVIRDDVNHRGANELVGAIITAKREQKQRDEEYREADVAGEVGELEGLKRTQQYSAVLERCDRLLQQPLPDRSLREKILILKAESHALSGDEEDARAVYTQVLENNPQSSRALSGQGALAAYRSAWDRAEQLFQEARDLDTRNDSAWAGLGLCARNRSDWAEAWSTFSQALELNPENAGALYGAIDSGYQLGKLAEVEGLVRSFLASRPEDLEVQYALGECLVAQGKIGEAEQCLSVIGAAEPGGERYRQLGVRIAESRVSAESR